MLHRIYWVVFVALMAWPAGAQDRGVLAIDEEAGRHAFSFDSEADAVNICGTAGSEVVVEVGRVVDALGPQGVAHPHYSAPDMSRLS